MTARFRQRVCVFNNWPRQSNSSFFFLLQILSQHLAHQIPLVIRYHILQESAIQLQSEMLQMLQDKPKLELLLSEDYDIGRKREALQSRLKHLMKARTYLVEF